MQAFYDLDSLIAHANARLDDFDTISLDIFDTLFIRRVPDPNMIKIPVAQFIADQAKALDIPITPAEVRRRRNEIEQQHRDKNGAIHPDFEANYDQFMPDVLADIFGNKLPKTLFEQVAELEIRTESAMIVCREALVEWIKALKAAGKRVLLISDIYLPARYLEQLVADKGLGEHVDAVISSADSFQAKASGAAWTLVKERFGLDEERWLHAGDNGHSDWLKPTEFGITALHLQDIGEHHRLSLATRYNYYASKRDFWKGRNLYQWMLPLEAENQARDPLYTDGYGFFGFVLSFFIHRLIERCKDEGIERVYFCAREGWMFQQIWAELVPWFYPAGDAPEASYLYVSRMGLASPACAHKGLTPMNAQVARFPAGNRDFHDMCRIFKLDAEALAPHLARYDLTAEHAIGFNSADFDPYAAERFSRLLDDPDFQAAIKTQTADNNAALQRYLQEQGFFDHDKVALVDIGWLGTIQHYLSDAVEHRDDMPRVFGFTLGAIRLTPYRNNDKNSLEGLVFDAHKLSFYPSLTNTIKPIIEEICRAPHPTLVGYEIENGQSKLVFRHTDDAVGQGEIAQSEYYAPIHQGIVDAAKCYGPATSIYQYNTGELKPWLNFMYLSKVAFPKTAEILRIRHEEHQDDFFGKGKADKAALKRDLTLWTEPAWKLRLNPFSRLRWYLKSALAMIRH